MSVSAAPSIQLPPIDGILDRAHVVALPMAMKLHGATTRETFLIDGPVTWGGFVSFLEYEVPKTTAWPRSAIECACVDLPAPKREFAEVNVTIPTVTPERVSKVVGHYPGCRTFKVKVAESGQSLSDDIERIAAVRTAVAEAYDYESVVRMGANRDWSVEQAIRAAHELGPLEYMKQPVATVAGLREVRDAAGDLCPVTADGSIRKAEDPCLIAREQATGAGAAKAVLSGGPRRLLQLVKELKMKVTVASALSIGVGMVTGLFVAAAPPVTELQPEPDATGSVTSSLFIEDVIEPRSFIDGRLPVISPVPDPSRLAELATPGPRRDWWFDHLRAAYARLQRRSVVAAHHLLQHSECPKVLTPFMTL